MNPAGPRMVSMFAGVGGFDVGFAKAGFRTVAFVEKDVACQRVLWRRFPGVAIHGDIKTFLRPALRWLLPLYGRIAVGVGGSPCQDLSLAGLRAGLDGERSGLFFEMVRVCKRVRFRHVVWENVFGALSSNDGRDFAAVIRAFTGLEVEPPADGWGNAGFVRTPFPACRWNVAWRVLDARYFGVPQRRRRVFLVASLGDASCCEVLFEPESLSRHPLESRAEGEDSAAGTVRSSDGGCDVDHAQAGRLIPDSAGPLGAGDKGAGWRNDLDRSGAFVPQYVGALSNGAHGGGASTDKMSTAAEFLPSVAWALQERDAKGQDSSTKEGHLILMRRGGSFDGANPPDFAFKPSHYTRGKDGAPTQIVPPLTADADKGDQDPLVCCAFHGTQDPDVSGDVTHPLGRNRGKEACFAQGMAVRRLTPIECERLQGFPDHWTAPAPDTPRYNQLGNAVATVHAEWIGRRLAAVLAREEEEALRSA